MRRERETGMSIVVEEETFESVSSGLRLCARTWLPNRESEPESVVVLLHGYGAHGCYPAVRMTAEWLAEAGCRCHGLDFAGHGKYVVLGSLFVIPRIVPAHGVTMM